MGDRYDLTIGAPHDYTKIYEMHNLRFERYFKLPQDLRLLKEKMRQEAQSDKEVADRMRSEEQINPWIITDLDYALDGNPFVK